MNNFFNRGKSFFLKFKDLTSLGISTIVSSAIGGLFWLYMASLLGSEKYGEVSYLISVGVIVSTVSLVGMTNTLVVYGAKGTKIQSTGYVVGIISSLASSIILFFVFIPEFGISLYVIGSVLFTLIISDFIGRKSYSIYAKFIIIQKILSVILSIGFYYLMGFHGVILGIAVSFFPFMYIIYKSLKHMKIDLTILKNEHKFIVNSYLLDLSNALSGSIDKIIIAPLLGFYLLGNFSLGVQFLAILNIIPGIFYNYVLSHDASGNSTKSIKRLMIFISILLAILTIALAPLVLPPLFPKFAQAISVIQIISISSIPGTISSTYISKYLGLTNSKIVIIGSGVYLLIQVVSLLILSSIWGINGAAISIVIASALHAIYFVIIDNFYKIRKIGP